MHATTYPDGWDFNGVSCNTDCNTANTCKTDGDDYILVPVASENARNPEKSWTRYFLFTKESKDWSLSFQEIKSSMKNSFNLGTVAIS